SPLERSTQHRRNESRARASRRRRRTIGRCCQQRPASRRSSTLDCCRRRAATGHVRIRRAMPTVLITGATDGLGLQVARDLAGEGWTVLLHGRSRERGEAALAHVPGARLYLADLASLDEVRRLADDVLAHEDRLDVLCNNAG